MSIHQEVSDRCEPGAIYGGSHPLGGLRQDDRGRAASIAARSAAPSACSAAISAAAMSSWCRANGWCRRGGRRLGRRASTRSSGSSWRRNGKGTKLIFDQAGHPDEARQCWRAARTGCLAPDECLARRQVAPRLGPAVGRNTRARRVHRSYRVRKLLKTKPRLPPASTSHQ